MSDNEKELQDLIARLEQYGLDNSDSAKQARLLLQAEHALKRGEHALFSAIHKELSNATSEA